MILKYSQYSGILFETEPIGHEQAIKGDKNKARASVPMVLSWGSYDS